MTITYSIGKSLTQMEVKLVYNYIAENKLKGKEVYTIKINSDNNNNAISQNNRNSNSSNRNSNSEISQHIQNEPQIRNEGDVIINHLNNIGINQSSSDGNAGFGLNFSGSLIRYDNYPFIRNQNQIVIINQT